MKPRRSSLLFTVYAIVSLAFTLIVGPLLIWQGFTEIGLRKRNDSFTFSNLRYRRSAESRVVYGFMMTGLGSLVLCGLGFKFLRTGKRNEVKGGTCPSCGGQMVRRTASKGRFAGKDFWGCSNYPICKVILPIEQENGKKTA